jgi:uncharacterized protein YfaS (alpha-2-macroglobulin family)
MELSSEKVLEIQKNITAGIDRISTFQTYNGGLSYWPGESNANDWGTSYAGHFLILAGKAGYNIPNDLMDKWTQFQKNSAASWSGNDAQSTLNQAYRLYTLALSGNPDLGSMNRLRERQNLPSAAAWRLAAAYWYAGQRDAAQSMIRGLQPDVDTYRELSGTFGSSFRDKSMMLETLSIMGEDWRIKTLYDDVAERLASDDWLSTQETSYALLAVLPYVENERDSSIEIEYRLNGGSSNSITFNTPIIQIPIENITGTRAEIFLANNSSSIVHARIAFSGLPEEGSEPAISAGINLSVAYRDMNGRTVDPKELPLGEDMEVRLVVSNRSNEDLSEVAVVHMLPASWELINTRLSDESGSSASSTQFKYQDIRDDRVMTYFDLPSGRQKIIRFTVNKTYNGNYYMPAIHAYAMYDESIRAVIPGTRSESSN